LRISDNRKTTLQKCFTEKKNSTRACPRAKEEIIRKRKAIIGRRLEKRRQSRNFNKKKVRRSA